MGHSTREKQQGFAGEASKQPCSLEQQSGSKASKWEPDWRKSLAATVSLEKGLTKDRCCRQPSMREDAMLTPFRARELPQLHINHQLWPSLSPQRSEDLSSPAEHHQLHNNSTYCHILAFNLKGN